MILGDPDLTRVAWLRASILSRFHPSFPVPHSSGQPPADRSVRLTAQSGVPHTDLQISISRLSKSSSPADSSIIRKAHLRLPRENELPIHRLYSTMQEIIDGVESRRVISRRREGVGFDPSMRAANPVLQTGTSACDRVGISYRTKETFVGLSTSFRYQQPVHGQPAAAVGCVDVGLMAGGWRDPVSSRTNSKSQGLTLHNSSSWLWTARRDVVESVARPAPGPLESTQLADDPG